MRDRDSQRQRVYKAQRLFNDCYEHRRHESLGDIEEYVRKIFDNQTVIRYYARSVKLGIPRIENGRVNAKGGAEVLIFPAWARSEPVIIHEVAHCITNREYEPYLHRHNWQYCDIYLRLVLIMLGVPAYDLLRESMIRHKVKFHDPNRPCPDFDN